jgi:hypothetical protein
MNQLIKYRLLIYLGTFFSLIEACSPDNSTNLTTDARDKFVGKWTCKETIASSSTTFQVNISKLGSQDSLKLTNFSNYGDFTTTYASVSGNSIVIPSQNIGVTNVPVGGSGIYSSSGGTEKIQFSYLTDGQNATALYTK